MTDLCQAYQFKESIQKITQIGKLSHCLLLATSPLHHETDPESFGAVRIVAVCSRYSLVTGGTTIDVIASKFLRICIHKRNIYVC